MPTVLAWNAETPDLLTASVGKMLGRPAVYLTAEAIHDGGWDWAAWTNHSGRNSLQGTANSRSGAMKNAELAARMLLVTRILQAA